MLIGHQKQWQFLKRSVELGKISHAYLFFGQEKLGKKTLAFEFIKLINCQDKDSSKRPCQNCRNCIDIQKKQHPDLVFISPTEKEIQIPQIRDLIWRLALRPFVASFKTVIIDQAHLMNQEAQSCFLKTLEEPRGDTVLILITEYPEMLFKTILSRVQKIKFFPVTKKEIENFLVKKGIAEKEAQNLTNLSSGKPGLALDFFRDSKTLADQKQRIVDLIKITALNSDLASRFNYAKNLSSESQDLKRVLEIWLGYFRSLLLSKINFPTPGKKNQNDYSLPKLEDIIKTLQNIIFLISATNINHRLALEILMLKL